ncbi:MAG: DUF4382 domain-containing protein [Desulfobacterales bacterium]
MKALNLRVWIILSLSLLILTACGGGGSDEIGTGTVSVGLTDSSTAKYLAIYVTIDEVQVNKNDSSPNGNSGWVTVATPKKTYNLLKLVNGLTEILGENELEAGTYRQIRLIIGKKAESENNIKGEPHPYANYVVLNDIDGSYVDLKIPSGFQTGVKLVHNFEVEEGSFVELVLDFEACRSVVETGSEKYILKPTIKVIETANKHHVYGTVTDNAEPALPVTGALVSAQISDGYSASVVRSTLKSEDEEGQYSLLLSPGQTYNMVVYSDINVGGQMYSPACAEITVPLNGDLQQDFTLAKSDFGTINGTVTFSGDIDPDDPPVIYLSFYTTLECGDNNYVEVTSFLVSPDPVSQIYEYSVDLPVGNYDVVASSEGFDPKTETATLPSGVPVNISFEF